MKGYRLNEDAEHVAKIVQGIQKKGGHCPCRLNRDETSLCPCDEFVNEGVCRCKLFVKIAEEN